MPVAVLPSLEDNYIFALACAGMTVAVDPGDAAVVVRHLLVATGTELGAILITHHHPDHVAGIADLRRRWPKARCIGPADSRIAGLTEIVTHGDSVILATDCVLKVIATPGHTRSHICYVGLGYVFCGDVLFSLGCGRVFEGDAAQMLASLDQLAALPDDTRVYCAHEYTASNARFALGLEPQNSDLQARAADVQRRRALQQPTIPSSIGSERRCNPFLRTGSAAVRDAASRYAGVDLRSRVEVFAALRAWKNVS